LKAIIHLFLLTIQKRENRRKVRRFSGLGSALTGLHQVYAGLCKRTLDSHFTSITIMIKSNTVTINKMLLGSNDDSSGIRGKSW